MPGRLLSPLGATSVLESQRRLAELGLFRRTRITQVGHGDETRRDVLVSVEESPVTTIGYGGGLEAGQRVTRTEPEGAAVSQLDFAPRAFFEIGRRNLFDKNRSINLFTRVSLRSIEDATIDLTEALGARELQAAGKTGTDKGARPARCRSSAARRAACKSCSLAAIFPSMPESSPGKVRNASTLMPAGR